MLVFTGGLVFYVIISCSYGANEKRNLGGDYSGGQVSASGLVFHVVITHSNRHMRNSTGVEIWP